MLGIFCIPPRHRASFGAAPVKAFDASLLTVTRL